MTTDEEVRRRARGVTSQIGWAPGSPMTAFMAARCIMGIINIMTEVYGPAGMRQACVDLVRCDAAWDTKFRELPRDANAQVLEPARFLAHATRGILLTAGSDNLRAAMAFWATEMDAATLQQVVAGVSPA